MFSYRGKPVGSIKRSVETAFEEAGIPDATLYACRHTFGTALGTSGRVDVRTLALIMGHSRIQTTMRYLHPDATAKREAVSVLDQGSTREGLENEAGKASEGPTLNPVPNAASA